jgi:hypothetical protein
MQNHAFVNSDVTKFDSNCSVCDGKLGTNRGGVLMESVISGSYMEYVDGVQKWWSVRFQQTDAGRSTSRRPKQQNDCTVRAVALALNVPYDVAYDDLAAAGRECSRGFHFLSWALAQPRLRWIPFQAVKGQSRMNAAKFCTQYSTGRWIIRTAKHVCVVVDGVVLDTSAPNPARCVYGAWEVVS